MAEVIIENIVSIVATLLITLIGIFGAWLTKKIGTKTELANIADAQREVILMAQQTVGELQQTVVDGLKEASADGKLSDDEISMLGQELISKTMDKMSDPTKKILNAAGVDIKALITSAGEYYIAMLK